MMNFKNLQDARTATDRMDALCEFIEFWLGPRHESYGISSDVIEQRSLPMPLARLYSFAGRWPELKPSDDSPYVVTAFSHQDYLVSFEHLKIAADGKLIFLEENQAVWKCLTTPTGEDPPVWCHGDFFHDDEEVISGTKLVSDSLSKFLVTFILQELILGALKLRFDNNLSKQFEADLGNSSPLWINGPYVYGSNNVYWWNEVLVSGDRESYYFGANNPAGIDFLKMN